MKQIIEYFLTFLVNLYVNIKQMDLNKGNRLIAKFYYIFVLKNKGGIAKCIREYYLEKANLGINISSKRNIE